MQITVDAGREREQEGLAQAEEDSQPYPEVNL